MTTFLIKLKFCDLYDNDRDKKGVWFEIQDNCKRKIRVSNSRQHILKHEFSTVGEHRSTASGSVHLLFLYFAFLFSKVQCLWLQMETQKKKKTVGEGEIENKHVKQ